MSEQLQKFCQPLKRTEMGYVFGATHTCSRFLVQITDIINQLAQQLNKLNEEISEFVVKYKIRTKSDDGAKTSDKETRSTGVLV